MASIGLMLTMMVMMIELGCEARVETVPEGALALVGEAVIEPGWVESSHAQLDAFGQARFRGPHGRRALVEALIQQELLVQEAREAGFESDGRVEWAVLEELAELQLAAMLERRLPRAEVAADQQALRARYERERERFVEPERRRMRVVRVDTYDEGERALARMQSGMLTLDTYALEQERSVARTPLMKRDDQEFPAYHRYLFDPSLEAGALVPVPVLSGQLVLIGLVDEVQPAQQLPFEHPEVQEQLVTAERDARLAPDQPIMLALQAELSSRFPER
jgi:PPIC-type PPIASE domain